MEDGSEILKKYPLDVYQTPVNNGRFSISTGAGFIEYLFFISIYTYIYTSVYLMYPIYLSVCLFVCLSNLSVYLSINHFQLEIRI